MAKKRLSKEHAISEKRKKPVVWLPEKELHLFLFPDLIDLILICSGHLDNVGPYLTLQFRVFPHPFKAVSPDINQDLSPKG
jgi:hypothetical protein